MIIISTHLTGGLSVRLLKTDHYLLFVVSKKHFSISPSSSLCSGWPGARCCHWRTGPAAWWRCPASRSSGWWWGWPRPPPGGSGCSPGRHLNRLYSAELRLGLRLGLSIQIVCLEAESDCLEGLLRMGSKQSLFVKLQEMILTPLSSLASTRANFQTTDSQSVQSNMVSGQGRLGKIKYRTSSVNRNIWSIGNSCSLSYNCLKLNFKSVSQQVGLNLTRRKEKEKRVIIWVNRTERWGDSNFSYLCRNKNRKSQENCFN